MIKQRIRDYLRTAHTDADLKTWFDPLLLRFADASGLEVRFPYALFAKWFAAERRDAFEREIRALLGPDTAIQYRSAKLRPAALKKPSLPPGAGETPAPKPDLPAASAPAEGPADQCRFDNFIHNSKNEFPFSMAREVAGSPRNPLYNPFVICGKGTCGKTHLLRAIARTMAETLRWENVFLGTVDDLAALREGNGGARKVLDRCLAVCLDNAQDLAGHPALQQELISLADLFREKKKPLVLALDEGLALAGLHEKLRSRLESGLIVSLKKPDLDIRLRYARSQAERLRLQLKKEYLLTLVQRFQDFRHLEGTLTKLAAFQARTGRPIGSADLDKILVHANMLSGLPLSAESIVVQVAEHLALTREDILADSRKADIVRARQISMYLCRELLGTSLSALGAYFNGKNHATVLHACKKIMQLQESNKDIHNLVSQIRKKCSTAGE